MWLHLGTVPDKWTMWEDRVLVCCPQTKGRFRCAPITTRPPKHRPAGPAGVRQKQPWRRWHLSFDGSGLRIPQSDMLEGVGRDGPVQPFAADLEVNLLTPAWMRHCCGPRMRRRYGQPWLGERALRTTHACRGNGDVAVGGVHPVLWVRLARPFPRGARPFHARGVGWTCDHRLPLPSGQGWGLSRYYASDGRITLEGGYVFIDGRFEHARVIQAPRLSELKFGDEVLPVRVEYSGGVLDVQLQSNARCGRR